MAVQQKAPLPSRQAVLDARKEQLSKEAGSLQTKIVNYDKLNYGKCRDLPLASLGWNSEAISSFRKKYPEAEEVTSGMKLGACQCMLDSMLLYLDSDSPLFQESLNFPRGYGAEVREALTPGLEADRKKRIQFMADRLQLLKTLFFNLESEFGLWLKDTEKKPKESALCQKDRANRQKQLAGKVDFLFRRINQLERTDGMNLLQERKSLLEIRDRAAAARTESDFSAAEKELEKIIGFLSPRYRQKLKHDRENGRMRETSHNRQFWEKKEALEGRINRALRALQVLISSPAGSDPFYRRLRRELWQLKADDLPCAETKEELGEVAAKINDKCSELPLLIRWEESVPHIKLFGRKEKELKKIENAKNLHFKAKRNGFDGMKPLEDNDGSSIYSVLSDGTGLLDGEVISEAPSKQEKVSIPRHRRVPKEGATFQFSELH